MDNLPEITNDFFHAYYSSQEHLSTFDSPTIFAALTNNDIPHYGDMQHDEDHLHFEADMRRKVANLLSTNTVEIIDRSSMPPNNKHLQAIWSFWRKCLPDWTIQKYKARLCPMVVCRKRV